MRHLQSLLILATLLILAVGSTQAAIVPLAVDPRNVADNGIASAYTGGGDLVTPVGNANDTEWSPDIAFNLLTITGEFLGIQIDLAAPSLLVELGAYVDPPDSATDPFKNTDFVEFLVSTDGGGTYASVGLVTAGMFTPFALGSFSYAEVDGIFEGVTNVRYLFHQADGGSEGQRIPEVIALEAVPEPATMISCLSGVLLAGGYGWRRRKTSIAS